MKPQHQPQPQDDNAQWRMEARRDALRFEHWLKTPEGQQWQECELSQEQTGDYGYSWER